MIITAKYPPPDVLLKMVAKKSSKKDQKDLKEAKGAEEGTTQEAQAKHGDLHHECKEGKPMQNHEYDKETIQHLCDPGSLSIIEFQSPNRNVQRVMKLLLS